MSGKKLERLDIPKCVRSDELLRVKLLVVVELEDSSMAHEIRLALKRAVDQKLLELGKEAMDLVCRRMSENAGNGQSLLGKAA